MPETESTHANALTKTMSSHLRPIDNATTPSDKGAPHVQWERCSGKHKLCVTQRHASHMATLATSTKPPSPNTVNIHEGTDPLHVRHGGPRTFWTETSWWNTMVFALCGKAHGPHMRKQVLNTSWVLYRGNKTTIRRVDSTQADKLRSSAREHAAHTTCGNLCYVNTWSLQKNTYAELIDGTAPNGNTNTTNRLNWIGAPNILTACTTCSASISAGN